MIKSNFTLSLRFYLLILIFSGLSAFGQIIFHPGTTDEQKKRIYDAIDRLERLGDTGASMVNYVNTSGLTIRISFSSTASAGISSWGSLGILIRLNSSPDRPFLNASDYSRLVPYGEVPRSGSRTTNDAIVLGHEFAHIPTYGHHSNNFQRETDVIKNYENDFRAAAGLQARTSYNGRNLGPNRSIWQWFSDWWTDLWGE